MNHVEPDHEDLHTRAARILNAMADTPIPAMDATFYAHYAEELLLRPFLDRVVFQLLFGHSVYPMYVICVLP